MRCRLHYFLLFLSFDRDSDLPSFLSFFFFFLPPSSDVASSVPRHDAAPQWHAYSRLSFFVSFASITRP